LAKYTLSVDNQACWGCKACEVACKQENQAPAGIRFIRVTEDGPNQVGDRLRVGCRVDLCRHCDLPDCVEACPVEAIIKREDGLVILDDDLCNGCGLCIEACPFEAIAFDKKAGKAKKCNLCHHRIDQGLIPACADNVCLAHCIYFEPADRIEAMMAEKRWLKDRLAADAGE
jgi:Fe-S-cluster-containing dehydrogenase component